MEIDMNENNWSNPCPKYDCRKDSCKCGLKKIVLPSSLGDDSKDSSISPKNGNYCNAIVVYEANGHIYLYSKEGIPTLITAGGNYDEIIEEIQERLGQVENGLSQEAIDRIAGDRTLQNEIDTIKNSPDVVDIVPTYVALQSYDTTSLGDNDIVRVLQDEQHDGQSTYYRWNATAQTWTYIGTVGDYYTKGQVDGLLNGKQDVLTAGANITISTNNEISATDTTYSDFVGTDGQTTGTAGLVPAPATTDVDKFLKSDGTWAAAGGGGIRTLTTADYNYPVNNPTYINLGLFEPGIYFVDDNARIYDGANIDNYRGSYTFVVTSGDGDSTIRNIMVIYPAAAASSSEYKIRFFYTFTSNPYPWSARGKILSADYITNNLTTNNANRVLSAAQGMALKSLINGLVISGAGAPTTSTAGTVGQLYEDTTNGKLYQCTAVSGSTYTWSEVGGGGGGGDTVYSDKSTSNSATGGAVYIGNLDANQDEQPDPTTADSHYHYFWALPYTNNQKPQQSSINILGQNDGGSAVSLGINAIARLDNQVAVGAQTINNYSATNGVALGYNAQCQAASSVALGAKARATRAGEVNIGNNSSEGFNNTEYRVLGGVHDGQLAQDAVTVSQVNSVIDSINTALSTNIPHIGA